MRGAVRAVIASEAKQSSAPRREVENYQPICARPAGLLRFARNDDVRPNARLLRSLPQSMSQVSDLPARIRAVGGFAGLPEDRLDALIAGAERLRFAQGEVLMAQGEPSDFADLLLEGEVQIDADSARGSIPIGVLRAPALIGEVGAFAGLPRTATVRARCGVRACASARRRWWRLRSPLRSYLSKRSAGSATGCGKSTARSRSTPTRWRRWSAASSPPS